MRVRLILTAMMMQLMVSMQTELYFFESLFEVIHVCVKILLICALFTCIPSVVLCYCFDDGKYICFNCSQNIYRCWAFSFAGLMAWNSLSRCMYNPIHTIYLFLVDYLRHYSEY